MLETFGWVMPTLLAASITLKPEAMMALPAWLMRPALILHLPPPGSLRSAKTFSQAVPDFHAFLRLPPLCRFYQETGF